MGRLERIAIRQHGTRARDELFAAAVALVAVIALVAVGAAADVATSRAGSTCGGRCDTRCDAAGVDEALVTALHHVGSSWSAS